MTARAEGFWWVRMRGPGRAGEDGCPWEVAHLYGTLRRTGGNDLRETEECIEWGPYLGKEPGDQNRLPGLSRWGKLAPAGADIATLATLADHADDCDCDWCHRLTESEVNAIEARLRQAEETPTP